MTDRRVVFDFAISFANGGGIQGQEFRLDIEEEEISDRELADAITEDLRLLMVSKVEILNKRYITEPHKRAQPSTLEDSGMVDLSHPIRDGMVTYPGLPGPSIRTQMSREESRSSYATGTEFHIGAIDMVANTGTYIDTPFHRYRDGYDVASLPLDRMVAVPGVVVDSSERAIGPDAFSDVETWGRAVLVRTGWDRRFGEDDYVGDHPHLTSAAARRLADGGAVLVGIDSANIDDTQDGERPAHTLLLAHQIPVVEHLTRLDQLPIRGFEFFAIPAPVIGVGTFPIRAIARW